MLAGEPGAKRALRARRISSPGAIPSGVTNSLSCAIGGVWEKYIARVCSLSARAVNAATSSGNALLPPPRCTHLVLVADAAAGVTGMKGEAGL
mmetsp:Transcript_38123/g.106109  ORF Transcript_38123/g.106109 Transcript_38123/m.106109 type:complete len:93 (-) Transcript_38123:816-1094(-)